MKPNTITIGSVEIPTNEFAIAGTALLGIRKSGKTYGAKGIAEQLISQGIPIVVFDAIGVWRYLKTPSDDASGKGFQIVVAGGEDADIPLTPNNVQEIIRAAMRSNVSLVIDLYHPNLSKSDWRKIVQKGFHTLLYENKSHGHRYIILEEAAEYCVDGATEVLTKSGWKKICNVAIGDIVSTLNLSTGGYEWNKVSRTVKRKYTGEMVHIKSKTIDCLMTPDHRAVIKRYQHDPARYKIYPPTHCEASKLPRGFKVPFGGAKPGPGLEIDDDLIRAIGWIATDGSRHSNGRNYLCVHQSKPKIREKMRLVLSRLGATEHKRNRGTRRVASNPNPSKTLETSTFFIGANAVKPIEPWLAEDIHRINRKLITHLNERQLRLLWQSLLEGDGGIHNGEWRSFYPGLCEGLADDFQEISLRLGVRTIKVFRDGQWKVSISPRKTDCWISHKQQVTKVNFSGDTFCLTVKNETFIARRNGRTFVTGNCPQRINDGETFAAVEKVGRMGGNAGLGLMIINQRSQEVNKTVLDLCDNLVLMRQRGSAAIDAVQKWMDKVDTTTASAITKSLPNMKSGDCWVWSENNELPIETRTHKIKSFHPDRTQQADSIKKRKSVDTAEFIGKLWAELPKLEEEKKQTDPDELRKRIRELERQLKSNPETKVETREVSALTDADRKLLNKLIDTTPATIEKLGNTVSEMVGKMVELLQPIREKVARVEVGGIRHIQIKPPTKQVVAQISKQLERADWQPASNGHVSGVEQRILNALAELELLSVDRPVREMVALMAGYTNLASAGYVKAVSSLRTAGMVDYPDSSTITLTQSGRSAARYPEMPRSSEEIQARICNIIGGKSSEILRPLIESYPNPLPREEVAGRAGYTNLASAGFVKAVSRLRTLGFINYPNTKSMVATDVLFLK